MSTAWEESTSPASSNWEIIPATKKRRPVKSAERCYRRRQSSSPTRSPAAEAIKVLPQLKLICIAATGMNNVDLEACRRTRDLRFRNAVGYSTHAVTETTIGAAIALLRQSIYYDRYVKSGEYAASDAPFHFGRPLHQLYGKRWGIIGLGAIGHKVAEVAAALGCQIAYTSTSGVERQEPYPAMPLDELLRWSDIVSIHAPLNDRTRGLVGARELALMKPSALLINVARGGIVDEQALADALDNKRLAGAGIDVFSREPMSPDNPLLRVTDPDRLLLSPHTAWPRSKHSKHWSAASNGISKPFWPNSDSKTPPKRPNEKTPD